MSVLSPFDKKVDVKEKPEKRTLEIPSLRQTGVRQERLEKDKDSVIRKKNPRNFVKKNAESKKGAYYKAFGKTACSLVFFISFFLSFFFFVRSFLFLSFVGNMVKLNMPK